MWTRECDLAFQAIKQVLLSDTLLKFPDLENPFIFQTDASGSAIGFVLGQEEDGIIKPINLGGKGLTNSEQNYSVTEKRTLVKKSSLLCLQTN